MKRTTIRDLATFLGVHHSTVSRAMKNDPRLRPETVERVQEASRKFGYKPDPMLSALMAYRSETRKTSYQSTLAWVTNYPTRDGWKQFEKNAYLRGAEKRAGELGYLIEPFWLGEKGITPSRVSKILFSRSIQGLLFLPQARSRAHLNLEWEKFSGVTFGRSLAKPRLHDVDNDHYASMSILMRQLKRKGYRRIALAIWPRVNESNDRTWTAAYWSFQTVLPQSQIPVFMDPLPWKIERFKKWMSKYRPDVVVSHSEVPLQWMQEMGLSVPGDVGFAMAAKHGELPAHYSGIDENSELVGETAINVLVHMIKGGEKGIPRIPISTLVEGSWGEGQTLRNIHSP